MPRASTVNRALSHRLGKPSVLVLGTLPICWLLFAALTDRLGANPAESLIRSTGDWALRFLCITLAVTPLRVLAAWTALARYRRVLGLFVYFYAMLHLLAYAWLDMGLDAGDIGADIVKRPFILVGFTSFLLLTPLALTSNHRAVRRLGAQRWQWLHRAVYAVAGLVVLHFFWMRAGKQDFGEVLVYGSFLSLLLGWRMWRRWRPQRIAPGATAGSGEINVQHPKGVGKHRAPGSR